MSARLEASTGAAATGVAALRATFRDQFFEVQGVSVGRDTGLVGVGIEFIDRYNLSTFIGYDLRVNSQLLEHNVNVGVLFFF